MRDYWERSDWSDDYKSRSQKKRESTALQDLGQFVSSLSGRELSALGLSDALRQAVDHWRSLKKHEALRRQMQYIGRLMREEPDETVSRIQQAIQARNSEHVEARNSLHEAEAWRVRLLAPSEQEHSLEQFLTMFPQANDAVLRHHLETAMATNAGTRKKGMRELFRYIREAIAQETL